MIGVFLAFGGNAAEAAAYYTKVFRAPEPFMKRKSDAPAGALDGHDLAGVPDFVMYANVKTFAGDIMMSDAMPAGTPTGSENFWIVCSDTDGDELTRVFNELAEDGEIIAPLAPTFFNPIHGQVRDKFGWYWMIMQDVPPQP